MTEQTTPQGTWTEGPSVDSMSGDEAKAEIKSMEADVNFAGEGGKMDYWSRQRMLRRRDALYKHSLGEDADKPYSFMGEVLEKQGVSKKTLESDLEGFDERDYQQEKVKAMDALTRAFGGEDPAKQAVVDARAILKRFATASDMEYLDESGLGSDPNFIQKLAEIGSLLKKGGKK